MTSDTTITARAKSDRTETLEAAREHARIANRYRSAGLCSMCAPQAAYGAQLGWSKVDRPCKKRCQAVVATFPGEPKVNGWRSLPRDAA